MICSDCGTKSAGKTETKGHFLVEVALWFLFILPGVIYSVWRLASRGRVCPACGSGNLVPEGSPRGRELLARYAQTPPPLHR